MVRPVVLLLWLLASPVLAGDWSQAGGALIVGAPAQRGAPEMARAPDQPFAGLVDAAAGQHGLDPKLLHALVIVESGYRADAVSPAGAVGLTQLMPATARELGVVDPADPRQNLMGGAAYLAQQLNRFQDLKLALAAYNSGPSRVHALGRVPKIQETEVYVRRVIDCFLALTAGRAARTAGACETPGAKP